jgi:protein-S-isoprenylcysteine O-methyltransferase Ste14
MTESQATDPAATQITPRLKARYLIRETIGVALVGVILFWSAGSLRWPAAWALVIITACWVAATAYVLLTRNPTLILERMGPRKGGKRWDTAIVSTVGVLTLVRLVVAGLDRRHGWSSGISVETQVIAGVLVALAHALVVWATASNAFFSQIVRIQGEREHTVATGGPYRFVRHPGYVGTVTYELAIPFMLGSWWALAAGAVSAILFGVRTALEDRTLRTELPGYEAFAQQVKHRLLPGIW